MKLSLNYENDKYEIGEKIRNRRIALGLSQDDLADRMGTDRNRVYRNENGIRDMQISVFCQYCDALDVDGNALLPDRLKKPEGNLALLMETAKDLSEEDRELLLMMAKRMKKGIDK